ncbi:heavy metal translocating P-type ATPase [Polaromonas sp.]|uniref:heavy metal translocating P-type ATPase n=1 Tax=Polaromonas sp. TaxID=1869339 RepID=UPI00352B408D
MDSSSTKSCGTAACESLARQPLVGSGRPATDTAFYIEKMDCPSEERQIRQRLGQIAGVDALVFDLQQHRLTVTHRLDDVSPVTAALVELGLPPAGQEAVRTEAFHVPRMDCKNEVAQIRERLGQMAGVEDLRFDLAQRVLTIEHRLPDSVALVDALAALGMPAAPHQSVEVSVRSTFHVPKMDCRNEERQVRERLQGMAGIQDLEFDLPQRLLTVVHQLPDTAAVVQALTEIGMPPADAQLPTPTPGASAGAAMRTDTFRIEKMDCPTEEGMIRKRLGSLAGVDDLDFNLMQRKLTVRHTLPSTETIVSALKDIGLPPAEAVASGPGGAQRSVYRIENMDCPTEEGLIREKLQHMPGVQSLDFNLMQRKLTVSHTVPAADLESALHSIGMKAVPDAADAGVEESSKPSVSKRQWGLMAVAGVSAGVAEAIAFSTGNDSAWPVIVLALVSIATGGWPTYKKGWLALKSGVLNMNALMSIAVTGAILIGQWPEAAMVMFLFALAEVIEVLSLDRARNAIRGLLAMAPEQATVRQPDGNWLEVPAKTVAVGQLVRIRPGERIPLDGVLESGQSAVNQAPITGESIPVAKAAGDTVFAGTVNETGSFVYRVTAEATHSTLARIIKAVEEAQGSRAPTQRFVDEFAKVYTPAVFAVAFAVLLGPPLFLGGAWMDWVYKALVLLVIACPCALVISTPVTVVSGLAAAARRGILIKGGAYLELGRQLRSLALDKTGTITQGKPVVTDVVRIGPDEGEALRLAASLAARSDHPVSGAVAAHWRDKSGEALAEVDDFESLTGRGVKGRVGEQWYYLGSHRLLQELGIGSAPAEAALKKLEGEGKTAIAIVSQNEALAVIGVADTVRDSSREAIRELHTLGVRTVMLTGDNQQTASVIARDVGIDDARGGLMPDDKLKAIDAELAAHGTVGMVGDGINDAPALAKSSIGFAMGAAGTDTAIETADVALMDDDLRKIPQFIRLSRKTGAILKQNIVLALGIKAVFVVLALTGTATLWMAVFADMGASLLVVFNGLRLLKIRTA